MTQNPSHATRMRRVSHALHELRAGYAILMENENSKFLAASAEYPDILSEATHITISGVRAERLALVRESFAEAYSLPLKLVQGFQEMLVNPLATELPPASLRTSWAESIEQASAVQLAALKLAKMGSLLPAILTVQAKEDCTHCVKIHSNDVEAYRQQMLGQVSKVSEAHVPLELAENTHVVAFRPSFGELEHLAVVIGEPELQSAPLVRIHSSCVTGDILGSLRCDCGDQFKQAIARIAEEGSGIVLYLSQEGRGIGIANKLRAYALQDAGLDTVDANQELGFESDEREFLVARNMLEQLGVAQLRLLSNNPDKVAQLQKYGIQVKERVPHIIPANPHNEHYLATKQKRCGHLF